MRIIAPAITDVRAVLELLRLQLDDHAIALPTADLLSAVEGVFADGKRGCFLLAMAESTPIGIAYLSFAWTVEWGGTLARLEELYVLPGWRAQGAGTLLLQAAIKRATSAGCKAIDLEVQADHEQAGRLYARHGFARLPRMRWLKPL